MLLNMDNLYLKLNLILVQLKVRLLPFVVIYACHMQDTGLRGHSLLY